MELSHRYPRVVRPRLVGGALIAAGLLGILLSFAGMVFVAVAGGAAQRALTRELTTLDRALAATGEGLTIAETTLNDAERTLDSLGAAISDATRAISDTGPALDSLRGLTGTTLPQAIGSTRQALGSAQETARVADRVLGALSFLGLDYSPEVPLNVAIGRVSESLAPLPADLANVSNGLDAADANLAELTASLGEVGAGVEGIREGVGDALGVVDQYQEIVGDLRGEVAGVAETAPGWIGWARLWSFLFLSAIALGQIGLLAQGWELLGRAEAEGE
jgi:hypothetical protein